MSRNTIHSLKKMKQQGEKISCLTAYDYSFAALLDSAGIELIMVGDSLGMVIQGHDSTLPVALTDMVYHSACVARGCQQALLVVDLPFLSYQLSPQQALESAGRLLREGGAQVAKLEGGAVMAPTVEFLAARGVPVCGHLGLTPQSVHQMGGYRIQGKDPDSARQLLADAKTLEQAGASLLVLEGMPASLAQEITAALSIPTIGIGAGLHCDGQILVLQDMLGLYPRPSPKFSRNFMATAHDLRGAIEAYRQAVKSGEFPSAEESF